MLPFGGFLDQSLPIRVYSARGIRLEFRTIFIQAAHCMASRLLSLR